MSKVLCENFKINYEVYGESNETLIILNGIMMSCKSWKPFVPSLSSKVRLILMDFIDQGLSDFHTEKYSQELQVKAVLSVLNELNIKNCSVLGISYGGEIALNLAINYPSFVSKLILANTTAYTTEQLKDTGQTWIDAAKTYDGKIFFKTTIPGIYSWKFYEEKINWLRDREKLFVSVFDEKWYEGFIRLVKSAESHDVRERLYEINCPVLIIGSEDDTITSLDFQKYLYNKIKDSKFCILPNCGHASMYEQPEIFLSLVFGFLNFGSKKIKI